MKNITRLITVVLASATLGVSAVSQQEIQQSIRTIKSVGAEGKGNARASQAWQTLSQAKGGDIVRILTAMDNASPIASNWLRAAVHAVADREINAGRSLPMTALEKYLGNRQHNPRARRFAYDLIAQSDAGRAAKIIPGMINDPSVELRRDAVQLVLNDGAAKKKAGQNAAALKSYQRAFNYARDVSQIQSAVNVLRGFGKTVDVPKQFGFLMDWHVVGPFDNSEREGFARVYPPEKKVNLKAGYQGKEGEIKWRSFSSTDEYGKVDVNIPYGMLKEVTAYAYTEYESAEARDVELRLGCKNAWKIWVNGKFVFGRDEYHRGKRIDQYTLPVRLEKGANTILVKVCQNEQDERWTKEWDFQLRVSDSAGTAILAMNRKPTPKAALNPPSKKN
ncbi:MAG: hypothetical protein ACPGVU_13935 [Limisphaerales bacterium]